MKLGVRIEKFAFFILGTSISLRLLLSNTTLNYFYSYTDEGGTPLLKIHPGSILLFIGLLLLVLSIGISPFLIRQASAASKGVLTGSACVTSVILISTIRFGISNVAYLVDTYLYTYAALMMATYLSAHQLLRLGNCFLFFIAVNSAIALYEYSIQSTLMPNPMEFEFFRSHAFLGHPLNNALTTVVAGILLLAIPMKSSIRAAYWCLFLLGLLAFGARASTATYLALTLLFTGYRVLVVKETARTKINQFILSGLTIVAGAVVGSFLFFNTEIGSSMTSRLELDSSALARVESFVLIESLPISDLFWGVGPSGIERSMHKYMSIEYLENFWIVTILQFGLPTLLLLYAPLFKIAWRLTNSNRGNSWIFLISFLFAASSNNSLSVKTNILSLFFLSLYVIKMISTERDMRQKP